jgi:predicted transcriptional regulator of viral defense system
MMLMTYKEAEKELGSQYKVDAAVRDGGLFRIARGLYADRPIANHFQIIAKRFPEAIITADTAHYIHGLTDVIPVKTYLATLRNATRIADSGIVQVFVDSRHFEQGRIGMEYEGADIPIYNKERILVEILRNSTSMPFDYYKELIASYRRITDSLDFRKVEEYIGMYKRNEFILEALQREVL